ncbi:MAG: C45 family autoproteolytic acyltransferase/hydrolase [Ignavibacteria bacterium]|nr:C45 family autoproteolytic acyltransferase/hydrolase [Ignavibacteria bacterium]
MSLSRYLTALLILCIWSPELFSQQVPIENSGFENTMAGWQITRGPETDFSVDKTKRSEGISALCIHHATYKQSRIISAPVSLKIGHLYKVSAKISTENAFTEPAKQYPTPVAACISMASFPFTNHSPAVGATQNWQTVEMYFFATSKVDNVVLNFGYNGEAAGKAWFDEIQLTEISDITTIIPKETIKWYGKAFRFEDRGWINIHIEGKPFERGIQYGYLAANEIKDFITKFSTQKQKDNPQAAWSSFRGTTDLLFLRKFDEEYLLEMKGIAEGAAKAGITIFGRAVDFLDIVTINSAIDLDYAQDAIHKTATPLTGRSFLSAEDDLDIRERLHKCSGLLATKSATKDHRIVFGQLFMWGGYTGPLWNILLDVVPEKGNRLVYETFPGGIHSGADFYINSSGIMIGETTVGQTPFNMDGTPQSNRIRKAAQYANSIDDVVKIMTTNNNGLYTNDWLIGDTKTDEIAILLLGTKSFKLWRSSSNDFYGGQKDWYWSNNNAKDIDVRKEYRVNDDNAPMDLTFRPWDRDVAFYNFYELAKGTIDANACINLWNSSPINRPHACDGKVVSSDMAEKMMFFINYGKVTLREVFVNENGRIPDLPGAIPRLSLGYYTCNPVFIAEKIKELSPLPSPKSADVVYNLKDVKDIYSFDKSLLWHNTVYPATESENWFNAASAAYWASLNNLPSVPAKAFASLRDDLTELNVRYLYTESREGKISAYDSRTVYNEYKQYQFPRIKGTYALHQLRLYLGNTVFSRAMNVIHEKYMEKPVTTADVINIFNSASGKDLSDFINQFIKRDDIPQLTWGMKFTGTGDKGSVVLVVHQQGKPYHLFTTVTFNTGKEIIVKPVEISNSLDSITIAINGTPLELDFNSGNDILLSKRNPCTLSNFYDDFSNTIIVYGTTTEIEAQHALALRLARTAADRFTEIVLPVKKESELTNEELSAKDMILLGGTNYNSLTRKICEINKISYGKNFFVWNGKTYSEPDDGLLYVVPNPYNPKKIIYMFFGNSSLQLYNMLKTLPRLPQYAVYKGDTVIQRGYRED